MKLNFFPREGSCEGQHPRGNSSVPLSGAQGLPPPRQVLGAEGAALIRCPEVESARPVSGATSRDSACPCPRTRGVGSWCAHSAQRCPWPSNGSAGLGFLLRPVWK